MKKTLILLLLTLAAVPVMAQVSKPVPTPVEAEPIACPIGNLFQIQPGFSGAGDVYGNSGADATTCALIATPGGSPGGPYLPLAGGTMTGLLTTPEINAGPPESSLPPYLQGYTGGNTALLTGIDPDGTQNVAVGLESYDATNQNGVALYVVRLQHAPADGAGFGAIEADGIGGGTTTYAEVRGLDGYAELDDTASTGVLTDYRADSPENFSSGTVDKETGFYAAFIDQAPGVATIRAAFYSEDQGNAYAFYAEGGKIFSAGPLQVGGSVQMTGITGHGTAGLVSIGSDGTLSATAAPVVPLTGTTGSIGGGALLVNACATGTATVTGISSAMAISVTPVSDPNASTTQDYDWYGYMSGTNTVTVKVCALVAGTPAATTYNVRAIQ